MHSKNKKIEVRTMKKLSLAPLALVFTAIVVLSATGCSDKKGASSADSLSVDSVASADSLTADSAETLIAEAPMPKAADELFDDFVFNFAANRKLQFKRIQFPLPVYRGDKVVKTIEKNQWHMEHFFMRQDYYTLIFDNMRQMKVVKDTTISHVVVEKVFFKTKTVQQFVFDRVEGLWKMTSIQYKPINVNKNASFLKFYDKFATDSTFQSEHLHNPVKFVGPDPDDDFGTMTGDIEPETWPAFAPKLPSGMIYNILYGQKYTESNLKVFVIRGIANGLETELTFKKEDGRWMLTKLNM